MQPMQLSDEMIRILARHLCDRLEELSDEDRAKVFRLISTEFCLWCGKKADSGDRCEHEREM